MVGLNKPKLCTKFEDFSFSHYVNIEGERQIFGNSPSPRPRSPFFSACNFMMGLGKPQLLVKFKVAGFISYRNIRQFVFKYWDNPKLRNPLFFGKTDFTIGFTDPMFPIHLVSVQLLWSYDCRVIFTKNCI